MIDGALSWVRRRPVVAVFLLAALVRVVVAVTIYPLFDGNVTRDDVFFSRLAADAAEGRTDHWDAGDRRIYEANSTFFVPITLIYNLAGEKRFLAQLFLLLFGAGTAALLTALALRVTEVPPAMAGGLVVALLPSQTLYSSTVLKDPLAWFLLAALATLVLRVRHLEGRALATGWLGIALLALLLSRVRAHTAVVVCIALCLTSWWGDGRTRWARVVASLFVLLVIPWSAGWGPAGFGVEARVPSLEERREHEAQGGSAVPEVVDDKGVAQGDSVVLHLAHLPTGVRVVLLEPFPWKETDSRTLKMAAYENLIWYGLLGVSILGVPRALRRPEATAFPLAVGVGLLVVYALAEGNIGTAFRHRGELVWIVALLVACGVAQLTALQRRRREADALSSSS
jgi:hypothetical protein